MSWRRRERGLAGLKQRLEQCLEYAALGCIGGLLYTLLELAWRGRSHWTMFFLGGACFVLVGAVNESIPWHMPLWQQAAIGAAIITALEFLAGCTVNLWLGWGVWDYSRVPGNVLGQVCIPYMLLWAPVSLAAVVLDDCLRFRLFREERPHYNIGLTKNSGKIVWL